MSIDEPQTCRLCNGTFTIRALLEAATHHWAALNITIAESPCCQKRHDRRI